MSKHEKEFEKDLPPRPFGFQIIGNFAYILDATGRKITSLLGNSAQKVALAELICDASVGIYSQVSKQETKQKRDDKLTDRQRSLFAMLPSGTAADRLKEAMLQRAYDLLWDGDEKGASALLEFLPSYDGEAVLRSWAKDFDEGRADKSRFYGSDKRKLG